MAIPPEIQAMVNWVDQPAPQFAGDTQAMYFALVHNPTNAKWQGYMFLRPFPENHQMFIGSGVWIPNTPGSCNWGESSTDHGPDPHWVWFTIGVDSQIFFVQLFIGTLLTVESPIVPLAPDVFYPVFKGFYTVLGPSTFGLDQFTLNVAQTTLIQPKPSL